LVGVVDDHGKLVGKQLVATLQHEVPDRGLYIDALPTQAAVVEFHFSLRDPQAQRLPWWTVVGIRRQAVRRVEQFIALACGSRLILGQAGEGRPAAAALPQRTFMAQLLDCRRVAVESVALAQDGTVPPQTEGFEIGQDLVGRAWAGARRVEVLDTEQPFSAMRAGIEIAADGRDQ
jgi:hypothetical protein